MSLVFIVYLMGILPALATSLGVISFIGSFVSLSASLILLAVSNFRTATYSWEDKEQIDKQNKVCGLWGKRILKVFVLTLSLGFIASLIPSEKTMYTMAAVYAGEKIAETPQAQQIGNDAFDVLKGILAKAKRELAEETPKK